jgi:hypothetical protein
MAIFFILWIRIHGGKQTWQHSCSQMTEDKVRVHQVLNRNELSMCIHCYVTYGTLKDYTILYMIAFVPRMPWHAQYSRKTFLCYRGGVNWIGYSLQYLLFIYLYLRCKVCACPVYQIKSYSKKTPTVSNLLFSVTTLCAASLCAATLCTASLCSHTMRNLTVQPHYAQPHCAQPHYAQPHCAATLCTASLCSHTMRNRNVQPH